MKPLCIDLYCGLGGWAEGFLAEGFDVIGFDIEQRPYPAQLVLQDVLTLHGSQFKDAAVIVASPPCQAYSYRAMPWKRAKALSPPSNELFDACFRIQREASEAAGRYIPLVVENVKGAQPWVGRARWHYGSFYLWGDVPALMPFAGRIAKVPGLANGTFPGGGLAQGAIDNARKVPAWQKEFGLPGEPDPHARRRDGLKVPGFNFHEHEKTGKPGRSFQSSAVKGMSGLRGFSHPGSNGKNKSDLGGPNDPRRYNSKSSARKTASALIAKIPFPLSQHIARVYASQEPA